MPLGERLRGRIRHGLYNPQITLVVPWLSGWFYRKSHAINSAFGAGTNYQVRIIAHYTNGVDSGEDVYLNSHSRTDFGDVRFTTRDMVTLLDYWVETKVDGDSAVFYVKIKEDLSTSAQTIYIYYGKADATTLSSLEATATEIYDFENSFQGWTVENTMTTASITNKEVNPYSGLWSMDLWSQYANVGQYCRLAKAFDGGRKFYYWARWNGVLLNYKSGSHWIDAVRTEDFRDDGAEHPYTRFNFSWTGVATIRIGQYVLVFFGPYVTSWYYDYFWTFKYVSPEPSHGSWGVEESAS